MACAWLGFFDTRGSCGQGVERNRFGGRSWRTAFLVSGRNLDAELKKSSALGATRAGRVGQIRSYRSELHWHAGMKLDAQAIGFGCWMTEAVVTNRAQSGGQDVGEIAADKFDPGQFQDFGSIVVGAIFPTKGDGLIGDLEDSPITNGGAGHVSADVFEGGGAGASGLDVHSPLFGPDVGIGLPAVLFQEAAHVLAESDF